MASKQKLKKKKKQLSLQEWAFQADAKNTRQWAALEERVAHLEAKVALLVGHIIRTQVAPEDFTEVGK